MTVARVGLPGGLEPDANQLRQLHESGLVDHVEVDEQGLLIAWENIPAKSKDDNERENNFSRTIRIPLLAKIVGEFSSAPSQCYLNYHPERFHWSAPLKVRVTN